MDWLRNIRLVLSGALIGSLLGALASTMAAQLIGAGIGAVVTAAFLFLIKDPVTPHG
jgi:hypothetical protein